MKLKNLFLLSLMFVFISFVAMSCGKNDVDPTDPDNPVDPGPGPSTNCPVGAINGLFTVNEDGDMVYFSKGNLQYQASSHTWRFAEHQWDFVGSEEVYHGNPNGTVEGSSNHLVSASYSGWIDLFPWGTSGREHGAINYQPESTDYENYKYYAYGDQYKDLFEETGEADWGYNAISNGGNKTVTWHTLKSSEWKYLLDERQTPSGIRFAQAQIMGVFNQDVINGIVIVPDNWDISTFSFMNENGYGTFSSNVISVEEWNTLEEAGCVFLPAAGRRSNSVDGICPEYPNTNGYYWSSSHGTTHISASDVYFTNNLLWVHTGPGLERRVGEAVRLVQYKMHYQ